MSAAVARARQDADLLLRMAAKEFGMPDLLPAFERDEALAGGAAVPEEHLHGETCSCNLRGE